MLAWPLATSGSAQFLDSTLGYQLPAARRRDDASVTGIMTNTH
jgi:hypothetical protein